MNRNGWVLAALVGAAALAQSCSSRGAILLHNASGSAVGIQVFDYRYEVSAGETKEIRIDPVFGDHTFTIQTPRGLLCYSMPKVDAAWIKPGLFHATALGLLDRDGRIFLYPPEADPETYFKNAAGPQPEGFPLAAGSCQGSGSS